MAHLFKSYCKFCSLLFTTIILLLPLAIEGQDMPKHELRSTWIATVSNIDWPKNADKGNPEAQKADLIQMLELYQSINLNTIFLQVRPECDALYNSAYEPWSRYLTGTQGTYPGYDPLQFAIEEAHKRGIEVHAWMNPYRINASTSDGGGYYDAAHVYIEHPEWAMIYSSGRKILNPGEPEVMQYIGHVVRDLVSKYAVDGVHFDDYFYSYDGTPAALDETEYQLYGGSMSLSDWRRDNINRMIDTVYRVIQEENPNVRFGVSPFGIYKSGVPSGIVGLNAYSQIYCDPLAWLEDGNVDYLTPQQYWPTGGGQDFETLTNWWADTIHHFGRQYYPGHGTYRLTSNPALKYSTGKPSPLHEHKAYFETQNFSFLEKQLKGTGDPVAEWTLSQIGLQIELVRQNREQNALGNVFFSAKDFRRVNGLADYLVQNKYTQNALWPVMDWKDNTAPATPQNVAAADISGEFYLTWTMSSAEENTRYAIYSTTETVNAETIIANAANLKGVTFDKQLSFTDLSVSANTRIVVTAISPVGIESIPSSVYLVDVNLPLVSLLAPVNNGIIPETQTLSWESGLSEATFQYQLSLMENFSTNEFTSQWISDTTAAIMPLNLNGETKYFWRVRAKTGTTAGPWSEPFSFTTGFPAVPAITSPENLSQNVSTTPVVRWTASNFADNVQVEVSENNDFENIFVTGNFTASGGEGVLSSELKKSTWYYIRMKATNDLGESPWTNAHTFLTTAGEIPVIVLESPGDNALVASFDSLKWHTTTTTGNISFLIEVALDSDFNSMVFTSGWTRETAWEIGNMELEGDRTYYWRAKGRSEFGTSEYTSMRKFVPGYPSRPVITAPGFLSTAIDRRPEIEWTTDNNTDSVKVVFSLEGSFDPVTYAETFSDAPGKGRISQSLTASTWYFVRVVAINDYGMSVPSGHKYFETGTTTDINNIDHPSFSVMVYPSPVKSGQQLTMQIQPFTSKNLTLQILDIQGRIIVQQKLTEIRGGSKIHFITIPQRVECGIYYLRIKHDDQYQTKVIYVE